MKKLPVIPFSTAFCRGILILALAALLAPSFALAQDTPDQHESMWHKMWRRLGDSPLPRDQQEQDKAVMLARQGQYDEALSILSRLHKDEPSNQNFTRDYAAVLSWAGQDQDAVTLYETLPPAQPDYVLAAIGHSYRKLNQTDKALTVYRIGLLQYPNNETFAEGEIRCMADLGDLDGALAKANEDILAHGERSEVAAARKDILQAIVKREDQKAVELARDKHYPEALTILHNLYIQHSDDPAITRDYLAVLGWADNNDEQVVTLYKTLPAGDQPDYVLKAVGHSYRKLHQYDNALAVYQDGWRLYPDDVVFAEGTIRALTDLKKYNEALGLANQDLQIHGNRPEIVDVKKYILKQMKPAKKPSKKRHHHA